MNKRLCDRENSPFKNIKIETKTRITNKRLCDRKSSPLKNKKMLSWSSYHIPFVNPPKKTNQGIKMNNDFALTTALSNILYLPNGIYYTPSEVSAIETIFSGSRTKLSHMLLKQKQFHTIRAAFFFLIQNNYQYIKIKIEWQQKGSP